MSAVQSAYPKLIVLSTPHQVPCKASHPSGQHGLDQSCPTRAELTVPVEDLTAALLEVLTTKLPLFFND
jgi:hypothetical protein